MKLSTVRNVIMASSQIQAVRMTTTRKRRMQGRTAAFIPKVLMVLPVVPEEGNFNF